MDGTAADMTDGKSPEFLSSTSCSSYQLVEKVEGSGGGVPDKIAQKIKDFATQSPKLLKGVTDKVKGVGGVGGRANTLDPKSEVHKATIDCFSLTDFVNFAPQEPQYLSLFKTIEISEWCVFA